MRKMEYKRVVFDNREFYYYLQENGNPCFKGIVANEDYAILHKLITGKGNIQLKLTMKDWVEYVRLTQERLKRQEKEK